MTRSYRDHETVASAALAMPSTSQAHPLPDGITAEQIERFHTLQNNLRWQFEKIFPDKLASRTVVIIPSLTLDQEILSKIEGAVHYEERLLCLLMLLSMPRTKVIYVTSVPIEQAIIDYYLHLLPGITSYHSRQRLITLSCFDGSRKSLTQKILERPRLIERIRQAIPDANVAHIACFNTTPLEVKLSLELNLPLYGCDPSLLSLGSKSGSRKIFRKTGILCPEGMEDVKSEDDLTTALAELKQQIPGLRKAVVKVDEGFSGEGNAIFSYENAPSNGSLKKWVRNHLQDLKVVAAGLPVSTFLDKFYSMGGIVEEFIDGAVKTSPSTQCLVNPLGRSEVVSTHDQHLGGESGQVFLGAYFPAHHDYSIEIGMMGKTIADDLKSQGVIGRFSVDFLSVKHEHRWKHYAIEINLRKGGTTHPFLMLQFLTEGKYDYERGIYLTANGQPRYYYTSDNFTSNKYKGLTPHDLIDIAIFHQLQYSGSSQEGLMFHMIGALSEFGKLGVVCIGKTPEAASAFYKRALSVMNKETE